MSKAIKQAKRLQEYAS